MLKFLSPQLTTSTIQLRPDLFDMSSNIFRLAGYRGEHRQYYYLTPIVDTQGSLVKESIRKDNSDVNEWSEPTCCCSTDKFCCDICKRPSVFGPKIFNVPFSNGWGTPHQNWREDFFMRNKGSFYRIWNDDGKMVHVTEDFLNSRRCGTLPRVESVTVSREVENVCASLRTLL